MYSSMLAVFSVGVLMSSLAFLLRKPLLSLYGVKGGVEGSLEALALESALIRYNFIISIYFLCGFMDVCSGVLRGLGKAVISTIITLIGACLLRVVWLWTVFPLKQTLEVIFISYPVTWVVTTLVSFTVIQILLKKMVKREAAE